MPKSLRPTNAELAILRVLWNRGPSTVRQVLEGLGDQTGYTTALKFLQIMTEKGLVHRNEAQRTHVYSAAFSEEETQTQLLGDLMEKAFRGSAANLVMRALSVKTTSPSELAEIRKLIDQMEGGSR